MRPGVPNIHMEWIGRYIVDRLGGYDNASVIHLGDHWDMPSLSSYDVGKKAMEGRRYVADIDAGNTGFDLLNEPLVRYNKGKRKKWTPGRKYFLGNHEERITRAAESYSRKARTGGGRPCCGPRLARAAAQNGTITCTKPLSCTKATS